MGQSVDTNVLTGTNTPDVSQQNLPWTGDKLIDELIAYNNRSFESSVVPGAFRPKFLYSKENILKMRGDTKYGDIPEAEMDLFLENCHKFNEGYAENEREQAFILRKVAALSDQTFVEMRARLAQTR